jgi:predicted O-methyltransferase YrrM
MAAIVHPKIERYLNGVRAPRSGALREMEVLARRRQFPIVGPDVGRLLFILARSSGARRVLELGSGFGYSAFWFALALPPDGEVHCTDLDPENRTQAEAFLKKARLSGKLRFHVGDALELAATLPGPFDIVLNDIDKEDYPRVIDAAHALLRPGGLFITDNTLWDGKVARLRPDATTRSIQRFNSALARHPGFAAVILPLRDGVTAAVKL